MNNETPKIKMVPAQGNLVSIFKDSQRIYDELRPSLDKRIRGNDLIMQVEKEVKKIADAINLAKTLTRRLQGMLPTEDTFNTANEELGIILENLNQTFENLDTWENTWKTEIKPLKRTTDWFGPFSEDQAEEILKLRYIGHSIDDIAEMLNIKNTKELERMIGTWMTQSR